MKILLGFKMKRNIFYVLLCLSIFSLLSHNSCRSPFSEDLGEVTEIGDIVEGTGTIKYLSFEGGFYGIVANNDKHYDPINLPSAFEKDGLKVVFKAKIRRDLYSYHQWGIIVELIYIIKP